MPDFTINDLIGVRFSDHGRSKQEGYDCYGLAIEVSRRLGHELNDIWYEKSCHKTFSKNAAEVIESNASKVEETNELALGNLIIFSDENGNMIHIGVMLDNELFIHSDAGGVRVMKLEDYYRKSWKVYKWLQ